MKITDQLIRKATVISVAIVASVAALVSYRHGVTAVAQNGEPGPLSWLYPLTVDGLAFASSMSILAAARRGEKASRLSWIMMWSGVAATVAVNMLNGVHYHLAGMLIAAWPAYALVGSFELLMLMIKHAAAERDENPLLRQALTAFPDKVPSLAALRRTLDITDNQARVAREYLASR